jgi:hypothetical protein
VCNLIATTIASVATIATFAVIVPALTMFTTTTLF